MDSDPLIIRLPATLEQVGRLEDAIEAWSAERQFPAAVAARLQLVAEEITANVAMHGRGATFFELRVTSTAAGLRLDLLDDGPAFDPLAQEAPDTSTPLEDRDPGGLGVHLLRTLTQEARYVRSGETNRLTCILPLAA